jgi:hypothetical protein
MKYKMSSKNANELFEKVPNSKVEAELKTKAAEMFEKMQQTLMKSIPDEDRENFKKLGEKFHSSFDVFKGGAADLSTISMEEALAYVVESLKSGLHPSFLTEDEKALVMAGYGEEWYKEWGYKKEDIEKGV